MSRSRREYIDLWIAVLILTVIVLYHFSLGTGHILPEALTESSELPIARWISNALFFWLVGLLWVAFRRWKGSMRREAELNDIISSAEHEVVMVVDPDRTIIMCNETVKDVFGYDVDELIHQKADVLYGDDGRDPLHKLENGLKQMGFHRGEAVGKTKDGQDIILEIATASLKKGSGAVLMCQDITDRRRAEDAIRQAKEDLEAANRSKDKLLAQLEASYSRLRELEAMRDSLVHMVIHDMKTPLQVLVLQVQKVLVLAGDKLDAGEKESLECVLQYVRQLNGMTSNMLDLSRLEANKLPLNCREYDLRKVLSEAVEYLDALATHCSLTIDVPDEVPVFRFDLEVVNRVITNLLHNAIKYSPDGSSIGIRLELIEAGVRISVTDQGPGIAPEDMSNVFEKFGQVKGAKRKGSTGLGLTFAKLAVQAHGGRIGLESRVGEGSTFWFFLPQSGPPETMARPPLELEADGASSASPLLAVTEPEG